MKVLVTGANGFLGLFVVTRLLLDTDFEVVCFVRSDRNRIKLVSLQEKYPNRIKILCGSLLDRSDCVAGLKGVSRVYHLAAALSGPPSEMFLNSSVATDRLMSAIVDAQQKIEVVFCSSFSVYGSEGLPAGAIVSEQTPLEEKPTLRDMYSLTKFHQEKIVKDYHAKHDLPVAVLRPGVIYGPGSAGISSRVGLTLFGRFLFLGGKNLLPLTYVDNCAKAFVDVSLCSDYNFDVFNVVDDNIITCKEFLGRYSQNVSKIKKININYRILWLLSYFVEKYHHFSKGQLPDVFTRYKTAVMWVGRNYSNDKLKSIGWSPIVPTDEGLALYFDYVNSLNTDKPEAV